MRVAIICLAVLCALTVGRGAEKCLPAFPGAEGFGAFTPGGRGGRVIYVDSLQDYDSTKGETPIPGSLRQAIETSGPRTILFRRSGTIVLKAPLRVQHPFVTIAGQTAPGDGICIARRIFRIETHDVILRHVRFRLGDEAQIESGTFQVGNAENVIIDHCSMSWSTDENCTLHGYDARNLTLQWCLISESLNRSYHPKGEHGHGSLLRSAEGGFSIHHCLYAHNNSRNPRPGGYPDTPGLLLDFRNNIVYDWGAVSGYSGLESTRINYVANYFKAGPSTSDSVRNYAFSAKTFRTKIYLQDNFLYGKPEASAANWRLVRKWGDYPGTARENNCVASAFPAPAITTDPPEVMFEKVLADVGATLPKRDVVDTRVAQQVRSGRGRIIDSQTEVGGWPELKSSEPLADSDNDGLPDSWEKKFQLSSSNAADGAADADKDGYTNLEEYLNSTDPKKPDPAGAPVDFDNILAKVEALNALARKEIAEEVRSRPPGIGADGSAPAPLRKMEVIGVPGQNGRIAVLIEDGVKLELNPISAGEFVMGSPPDEPERGADEIQHRVRINRPFYMSVTPVTVREFQAVTGAKTRQAEEADEPAVVAWVDAIRFCTALSTNTGRLFRLPTEAEWEYCCRAGTKTAFNTGSTISTDQANFDGKFVYPGAKPGIYRRKETPVRTFAPNAWGLYDMHGNAYQWCSDWYGPYPEDAVTDPKGPDHGNTRVIRGGKYGSGPRYIRSASRYHYNPNNSSVVFGFRIVMEESPQPERLK